MQFDFEIDKLTHYLEDTQTGATLLTEILPLEKDTNASIKLINQYFPEFFNK